MVFLDPTVWNQALRIGVLTLGIGAMSCSGGPSTSPDGVEFATLDKLVEVTGCVRSDSDSGYSVSSDSGWGWDSGSGGDSGWGYDSGGTDTAGDTASTDTAATDTAATDTAATDTAATDTAADDTDSNSGSEALDTAERSGSQSSAPPKSRPCMPSERIDEVQTASCSGSSTLKGSLLVVAWSLPFLFGRRRSS